MEKPNDIIESGEYIEPNTFESDREAILFKSYLQQLEYIDFLESKPKRFKKPTITEIEDYCNQRNNGLSAERFHNHYESNGWFVGKTKMKDWKASIRTWERQNTNKNEQRNTNNTTNGFSSNIFNSNGSKGGKVSARQILTSRYSSEIKQTLFSEDKPTNS